MRDYDDGLYKTAVPLSRHPNILKAVIIGKKSWGLWVNQWIDGIVDWSFTVDEILNQFTSNSIVIPEPLLNDFYNRLERKKLERNLRYYSSPNTEHPDDR